MGQCLARFQNSGTHKNVKELFPDYYTESRICDYFVDRLPPRLLGEGIHLLRGGPGPIVCSWTHELLNDAGVHSYQDRELLLKTRDEIVAAVETHRQRLRQQQGPFSSRPTSCGDCKSRTLESWGAPDQVLNRNSSGSKSDLAGAPRSPSGGSGGGPIPPEAATAVVPIDKAAARQAAEAAAASAAAAAASATAFRSDGDGKSFKLTTDWLPAGIQLYRISEELRHMASSGLGGDASVHGKSAAGAAFEGSASARAAAAAAGGGSQSPLTTRAKSRLATVTSGVTMDVTNGERDDGGDVRDRDAAEATEEPGPSNLDGEAGAEVRSAAAAKPTPVSIPRQAAGGGSSCDSGSGGSGSGGSGGEDSGSPGSRSPGSTLGADSLAALTSLDPPAPHSPPAPPPVVLGTVASGPVAVTGDANADATCALSGPVGSSERSAEACLPRSEPQQHQDQRLGEDAAAAAEGASGGAS